MQESVPDAENKGGFICISSGPEAGTTVAVSDKLTIGRRPENDLSISDDRISRFHALIEREGPRFTIQDLGSTTGTTVNGKAIQASTILTEGTEVVVGQTVLRFTFSRTTKKPTTENMVAPPLPDPQTPNSNTKMRSGSNSSSARIEGWDAPVTVVPVGEGIEPEALDNKDTRQLLKASTYLQTLLTANTIISTELNPDRLFDKILDIVFDAFPADRAALMTRDPKTDRLVPRAVRAKEGKVLDEKAPISRTITEYSMNARVGLLTFDAGSDFRFESTKSIIAQNIRSAICAPMVDRGEVLGVIYLDTVGITNAFQQDHLNLLIGIAGPAGGALRNASLVEKLEETAMDTVFRLAIAAEYRDDETGFHIHRMSDYGRAIAEELGHKPEYCDLLKLASPMHDLGKIATPDAILKKPGRLTAEEFEIMKQHPQKGASILADSHSDLIQMAHDIALTHHEKYNGKGYPNQTKGNAIPIAGRIVAVADVFDALTSKRCYKPAFSVDKSYGIIAKDRGEHFDPQVIDAFVAIKPRILQIRERYLNLEQGLKDRGEEFTSTAFLLKKEEKIEPT